MANRHLAIYINDYLAGATTAVELLEHLEAMFRGMTLEPFLARLRADITADRGALESIMARLQIEENRPRQAAAWLAERFSRLKLRMDDPAGGPLHVLEAMDVVAIGIEGKHALWRALASVAEGIPLLRGVDLERLEQRATAQRRQVEIMRLEAARAAFLDS